MVASSPSPWPRRFALWTLLASLPLILFGGTVTTLRAGMAEDGWLTPDGYLLWMYPLELRLRNAGVFVEHHHREIGSLVGLLVIGLVVTTFAFDKRRSARWLSLATLFAICAQGALGGFRVLENSPDLAFLHGAFAHAVFGLIGANAIIASAAWRGFEPRRTGASASRRETITPERVRRLTTFAVGAVYAQIVVGAWLRHSGAQAALGLHLFLVALVVFGVLRSQAALGDASKDSEAPELKASARRLRLLLGAQILLGLAAAVAVYGFSGGFEGQVSLAEMIFATLHVLFGALLLRETVTAALWGHRAVHAEPATAPALASLGVAR